MTDTMSMSNVLMAAMMLPALVPMLKRYHEAIAGTGGARRARLTAIVGAGYLFVWTMVGLIASVLSAALMWLEMQQPAMVRAVPIGVGVVVLVAGAFQFTTWKAHALACCRKAIGLGRDLPSDAGAAWRHGGRLGLHCASCCGNLMVILLVIGAMDLSAMAVVTMAITLERLAPAGERVARAIGAVVVVTGVWVIARAVGLA